MLVLNVLKKKDIMTLTKFRREYGISQTEIADLVGVSRQTVSLYDKGSEPSLTSALKVAEALEKLTGKKIRKISQLKSLFNK